MVWDCGIFWKKWDTKINLFYCFFGLLSEISFCHCQNNSSSQLISKSGVFCLCENWKCLFVSLFIKFMSKKIGRVPLSSLDCQSQPQSPTKTSIKILRQKLPSDFFQSWSQSFSSTSTMRIPLSGGPRNRRRTHQSPLRDSNTAREVSRP